MDIKTLINQGIDLLTGISIEPRREVQTILMEVLKIDAIEILLNPNMKINDTDSTIIRQIFFKRKNNEPLAYILGKSNFFGYDFIVNKSVLIPRPDTERSVEILLYLLKNKNSMLEIGVGSGCVSIVCALMNTSISFDGVDISCQALEVANLNKNKYLVKNLKLWQSDIFTNVSNSYDIIYSNPPYIPMEEISSLQPSVKNYEPLLALNGGIDGLDFYKKIVNESDNFLNKNGYLVFEIGYNQGEALHNILEEYKFENIQIIKDYGGHNRVIYGKRR